MNLECLNWIIKYGPISFGLLSFLLLAMINFFKKRKHNLGDLLVVFLAGTSVPTGILLIYGAFDATIIPKLTDANIYSFCRCCFINNIWTDL